tara:strand:- start:8470 stop:12867 length:4398 start_codon:yes stop_codon:yes gene_type:complete
MAEQSKPNTFSAGMITDLDPSYQTKESYFTGLNVRVITNGDNSYSLENIKGPNKKYDLNRYEPVPHTQAYHAEPENIFKIHGAVVVSDYVITIEANSIASGKTWKIRKYKINQSSGAISLSEVDGSTGITGTHLWSGAGLFSDYAGEVEIESIVETENTHRIYCTDGLFPLVSINVKDSDIADKTVSDFIAFKPNLMVQASMTGYNNTGGALKYGSYSYTYRLASSGQANYTDWAPISKPINVVKGNIASDDGLTIKGESGALTSSKSIKISIEGISTEYEVIEVAAIHYSTENVPTISVIESGSISSSTYDLLHSGFETTTLVSGGIAAAIISNKTWNTCKTLSQKDNKLFAGNLTSSPMTIDVSAYKVKSASITGSTGSWSYNNHGSEENPHRHQNGSGGSVIFNHTDDSVDRNHYKFLGHNFSGDDNNPEFVLGAETPGYSSGGNYGFRISFDQVGYLIDETGTYESYAGELNGNVQMSGGTVKEFEAIPYSVGSSQNHADWGGGKPGPHNPVWDSKYRSFKRGECYRLGVVFYDLQGAPGFAHHIGDIKMPEAMDTNNNKLNIAGDGVLHNRSKSINGSTTHTGYEGYFIQGWQPFVKIKDNMSSGSEATAARNHYGWALIPRIDIRLPDAIKDKISGYKIVRAELQDNDKTIITQGLLNKCVTSHEDYGLPALRDKILAADLPYSHLKSDNLTPPLTGVSVNSGRLASTAYTLDTPDVTIGGKSYDLSDGGYQLRLLCPVAMGNENMTHDDNDYDTTVIYPRGGAITLRDDLANSSLVYDDGAESNVYDQALGFRYHWMTRQDLGISGGYFDIDKLKSQGGSTGLFVLHKNIAYGKSVVNGETVSTSESGLSNTFQNSIGQSRAGLTDAYYQQKSPAWNEKKQDEFVGGAVSTIFLNLDSNITETSAVTYDSAHDYVGKSLGRFYNGGSSSWHDQKYYRKITSKWLAEIVRDTTVAFEQYGGYTISAIENTRFYDCSAYASKDVSVIEITGGDTFCDWYTYKNTNVNSDETTGWSGSAASTATHPGLGLYYNTAVPIESSYNTALRQGVFYGSSKVLTQVGDDNFIYNTAYSQESNLIGSVVKPFSWDSNTAFKSKIAASRTKLPGEPFDAWTEFPANDFIELNLEQGKITDLVNYKNQLYAIQDSGISMVSVNSRALIQGEGAAADIQIVSGTGAAIQRYDYLTTINGSQHFNKSLVSPTGFYVFDADKSEILKFNGQGISPLSIANGYKSYITGFTKDEVIPSSISNNLGSLTQGVFSGYDNQFRECHFNIVDNSGVRNNFVISDLDGKLISKIDSKMSTYVGSVFLKKYISHQNRLYAISDKTKVMEGETDLDQICLVNEGEYQDFNFGIVVNDNPTVNKVFDTSEIVSDVQNTTDLFSSHTLSDSTGSNALEGSNERIREGIHRVALRGNSTNRARGNWLKHTVAYNQIVADGSIDPDNDKKINIFAVNTRYRPSR